MAKRIILITKAYFTTIKNHVIEERVIKQVIYETN